MTINDQIDARVIEHLRATGKTTVSAAELSAALGLLKAVGRASLQRLERSGVLRTERQKLVGWAPKGPGSGKSPTTHTVRVTYHVADMRALVCTPVTVTEAGALLASN